MRVVQRGIANNGRVHPSISLRVIAFDSAMGRLSKTLSQLDVDQRLAEIQSIDRLNIGTNFLKIGLSTEITDTTRLFTGGHLGSR